MNWFPTDLYSLENFKKESEQFLAGIEKLDNIALVRTMLLERISSLFNSHNGGKYPPAHELIRMRDCGLALYNLFSERSEALSGFSSVQAVWDISKGIVRNDLTPGFFAELINWIKGVEGRADFQFILKHKEKNGLCGTEKAIQRSKELDIIADSVNERMGLYKDGLSETSQKLRRQRKNAILQSLNGTDRDWSNWKWQIRNVVDHTEKLKKLVDINPNQCGIIETALRNKLPFGVTPYYLSLMDDNPNGDDSAVRAQVFPPEDYVSHMLKNREIGNKSLDFMLESDTSPVDLITRRYPNVVILKPVRTCPQICVYCQRNWEIEQVMAPRSFANKSQIEKAIQWIEDHPAIQEVLVTGGDPFIMPDQKLEFIIQRLCSIKHIDLIRFGSRVLVTLPMRITHVLAQMLGKYRQPGKKEIAIMTHIEHPYEITPDTVEAVDRLNREGISIYNQQVYTFYVSRRFESTLLRILLRRIGINPYYTFMPKGKEETAAYQVPLARILQEQKEETRLVPGLRRTDSAVFNIPGLGKNYLLARQHRDLITVLPDGSRLYEFHPWDMDLASCNTYIHKDIAILDYLNRLADVGERPEEYDSIWYFF